MEADVSRFLNHPSYQTSKDIDGLFSSNGENICEPSGLKYLSCCVSITFRSPLSTVRNVTTQLHMGLFEHGVPSVFLMVIISFTICLSENYYILLGHHRLLTTP